jgi:hypothetical protein
LREEGNDHGRAGRVDHDFSQRFVLVVDDFEGNRCRAGRLVVLVVFNDAELAEHGFVVLIGDGGLVEQRGRHGRFFVVARRLVVEWCRRRCCVFEQPGRRQLFVDQQVIGETRAGTSNVPARCFFRSAGRQVRPARVCPRSCRGALVLHRIGKGRAADHGDSVAGSTSFTK